MIFMLPIVPLLVANACTDAWILMPDGNYSSTAHGITLVHYPCAWDYPCVRGA